MPSRSCKRKSFLSAHRFLLCARLVPDARTWTARNGFSQNACASSKDYLHCVLSLGKATILCTKCDPRPSLDPRHFETETHQEPNREQPERPSQRPSPRRQVCVRVRRPAGSRAVARTSRIRGSPRSGRQPRLTRRACRTLNSRGPDSAKDPGLLFFLSLRVCPRTPSSRNFQVYAARDVRGRSPASCSETPPPTGGLARGHSRSGSCQSCSSSRSGREVFNLATRVRVPHTAPSTSRLSAHARRRKPAATIGRLRNP